MKTKIVVFLSCVLMLPVGCFGNDDLPPSGDESATYPKEIEATDFPLSRYECWANLDFNTVHVINSEQELSRYFTCKIYVDIDFANYSLLALNVEHCNIDSKVEKLLLQQLSANEFLFSVDVIPSLTTNAAPLIVAVLVPKLPENATVELVIDIKHGKKPLPFTNIKWKLASFVSVSEGTEKTPEPFFEGSYSLIFYDDGTLNGISSTNTLFGSYIFDLESNTIQITNLGGTEINELFDGPLFLENLLAVRYFSVEETSLKLYYNETDYLLFNQAPPVNLPDVLLLKVDYTTHQFEGGQRLNFTQLPETFTVRTEYEEPGDFGWIKIYFSEIDELLFYGDIIWRGCGDIIFPATWLNADEFEHVTTKDFIIPQNGFENIFDYWGEDTYDYTSVWSAVQGLVEVRQMLQANQLQRVKLFLYTPSVGVGNPADWKWIIFLAGENLSTGLSEISAPISGSDAELFQNYPNPFREETTLRYTLPAGIDRAEIQIFDLNGTCLKRYPVNQPEPVVIKASELNAGIYIYSLIIAGKTVDTKRMILTK